MHVEGDDAEGVGGATESVVDVWCVRRCVDLGAVGEYDIATDDGVKCETPLSRGVAVAAICVVSKSEFLLFLDPNFNKETIRSSREVDTVKSPLTVTKTAEHQL